MSLARHVSRHGTTMVVSMMKDEAPYLLEWFAHHLAVGFTDILVYTNDCTDGTDKMLMRLEELGLGHHRINDIPDGIKPQPSALNYAQAEPLVQAADWVMVFDADEFVSINHPSGHLDGMLDDVVARDANGIIVTWRIFGSNNQVEWSRTPVIEQYTRAAPPLWNKGWGVKTLFRFDPEYWKLGIHRPSIKSKHLEDGFPDTVKWLNGSGRPMEDYFKFRGWRSIRRTVGFDWIQLNHYAVKSVDSYAVRRFRGNVNNKKDKYNADYWSLQDRNEVVDTRILRHAPRRAEIMAKLIEDPVLSRLHFEALERVEAKLDEYRGSEAYEDLRTGLIEAGKVPITKVEAKPPKPRDPAEIAALMAEVQQKANKAGSEIQEKPVTPALRPPSIENDYVSGQIRLSGDDIVEWAPSQEILLPCDLALFAGDAVMAVLAGKFDRQHGRNIGYYLNGSQRILDLGGGVGLPAMRAFQKMPGITVMVQDSQPGMAAAAAHIATKNGFSDTSRLKFVSGPLIFAGDDENTARGLAAYLRDFQPDTLRLSARADISPQRLASQDLNGLRRVILPCRDNVEMGDMRERFGPVLVEKGFAEISQAADCGTLRYDRLSERNDKPTDSGRVNMEQE